MVGLLVSGRDVVGMVLSVKDEQCLGLGLSRICFRTNRGTSLEFGSNNMTFTCGVTLGASSVSMAILTNGTE